MAKQKTTGETFHLTDMGNAARFAARHGLNLRYCWPWRKWLVWDGRRWAIDADAEVSRMAKETVRHLYQDAATVMDGDRRKALVDHARACERAARLTAMIDLARSEEGIPIDPAELDKDRWLLNCVNGTVDLRTGELRAHQRTDRITKLCPTDFDPVAPCPLWEQFLGEIFAGNCHLVEFVQRLLGYCLTGDVSEQVLPILHGTGANGKSTLVGTVLELLGEDFAIKAAPELVMIKRNAHPTERADLFGKRLVACVETSEGKRLAETLVKDLTGGDKQHTRRMREDFWQFDPTHKIMLATNHKPEIRGTDHAIWRRIRLVPFNVRVPDDEQDPELPNKLRAELPGILAWCVRGCLDWQQHRLGNPNEVRAATADYRQQSDIVAAFIEEKCLRHPDAKVKSGEVYAAYRKWCEETGEHAVSQTRFGEALTEKGFGKEKSGGHWRTGIGIKLDPLD